MTDELKYDPDFPYVVKIGQVAKGRFKDEADARDFSIEFTIAGTIIDTTPKPKIPEDANYIFVEDGDQSVFARREGLVDGEMMWLIPGGFVTEAQLIEDFIGDQEVTVLVRKEDS